MKFCLNHGLKGTWKTEGTDQNNSKSSAKMDYKDHNQPPVLLIGVEIEWYSAKSLSLFLVREIFFKCLFEQAIFDMIFHLLFAVPRITKFPTYTELKISNSDVPLQLIFCGNLPNLIKLSMEDCSILFSREALNVTY